MKNKKFILIGVIVLLLLFVLFKPDFTKITGNQVAGESCSGAAGICKPSPCHLYASYSSTERCEEVSGGSCSAGNYCCSALSSNHSVSACTEIAECLEKGGRCMDKSCYLYASYSSIEKCYNIQANCENKYCCSAISNGNYACINPTCSGAGKASECSNYDDCSSASGTAASDQFCCSGSCCTTKADKPILDFAADIPNCLNSSTNSNIYGKISFKLGANWWLPANETKINLTIFNNNLIISKIIKLGTLMNNATPKIDPVNLIINDILYSSYDSCNNNILAPTYTFDLGVFGMRFPAAGDYNYIISGNFIDENGNYLQQEIYSGEFILVNNCSLGLGVVSFQKSGGGSRFKNKDKIKCSAVVSGKFFSDLKTSPDILNFTLNYFKDDKFLIYKEFMSNKDNSGISCLNNNCYVEQNIYESHLGDWRCDAAVGDSFEKYIQSSNNLTMINTRPNLGRIIPNRTWETKTSYENAYNLNNYFLDLDSDVLKYYADGSYHIIINISDNGTVNLYQWPPEFIGNENITFIADDGINTTWGNLVILSVVGNISNISCIFNWSCESYGICQIDNRSYCNSSIDLNGCGVAYTGNYSEFKSCTYIPTSQPIIQLQNLSENPAQETPVENSAGQEKTKNNIIIGGIILGILLLMIITFIKLKGKKIDIFNRILNKIKKLKKNKTAPAPKLISEKPELKKVEPKIELFNLKDLKEYIKKMIKRGGNINEIKNKSINAGWNKKVVDETINLIRLENFVSKKLREGISKEKIKEILLNKKWDGNLIKKVLK